MNDAQLTLTVNPPGGAFLQIGNQAINPGGALTPSLANAGIHSFTYSVMSFTCSAKSAGSYTVNASPNINVSGTQSLCVGQTTTLTVSGASSYSWSNGQNIPGITVSPPISTTLFVTGTGTNACSNSIGVPIQVSPMPSVSIAGNFTLCTGDNSTLMATGANTYSWSNGSTGTSIMVSPLSGTSYTLVGSNSPVCHDTVSVMVHVVATPTINVTGNFSVCAGESSLLTANGADTYSWSNNATGAIIGITPFSTITLTVTGKTMIGSCTDSEVVNVYVSLCTDIPGITSDHIKIYPNPADELFTIKSEVQPLTFFITDVLGKTVLTVNVVHEQETVDISMLQPGVYYLSGASMQSFRKKIVIY
jgi:hypothetical protein